MVCAVVLLDAGNLLQRWNWLTYDSFLRADVQQPPEDIVIIAIDQKSLAAIGRWPWSRRTHAELLSVLNKSGARAIGFDVLFAEPDRDDPGGDAAFVEAVRASGRVVLPVVAEQSEAAGYLAETLPFPELAVAASSLGHADLELEADSQVRYVFLKAGIRTAHWPHMALALLQLTEPGVDWLGQTRSMRAPDPASGNRLAWTRDHRVGIPYGGPPGHFLQVPYVDVLRGVIAPETFTGRILLVGPTATGLGEALPTPLSGRSEPMPGIEIIAHVLQGLRSNRIVQPLGMTAQLATAASLVLLLGMLSVWLVMRGRRLLALALVPVPLLVSLVLFFGFRWWFEPVSSLLVLALAYPVWQWRDLCLLSGAIRSERRRAETTLRMLAEAVMTINESGKVAYLNPAAERLTGWSVDEAAGKDCEQVFNAHEEGRRRSFCYAKETSALNELPAYWSLTLRSGEEKIVRASFALLVEPRDDQGMVITLSDVTNERKLTEQIRYQATHDPVTQLPNRTLLQDRLQQAIARVQRSSHYVAVLFTDLDDFKKINDSLGHAAGDTLIRVVAARLNESVRYEDTVGRVGGDEFVIIIENLQDQAPALQVADKLVAAVREPQSIAGHEVYVTTSVGISFFPKDGENTEDLLRNADIAMYCAKESGGNSVVAFEREMNDRTLLRFTLQNDLQRALAQQEFRLLYQPIVDLLSERVVGVEALIRWQHPKRGLLTPDEFIPWAEQNGLIVPIGEWVVHTACADLASWLPDCKGRFRVAINLSPRQLQDPQLPDMVAEALQKFRLGPQFLELEITEEVLMSDAFGGITTLHRLMDLGLKVAIDDFGTGYSSFSYLKRFEVSRLKIDRSFVKDVTVNSDDAAIVRAIISMAKFLHVELTAEGVETARQASFFRQHGCIESQGFYFGKPMESTQVNRLLKGIGSDDSVTKERGFSANPIDRL